MSSRRFVLPALLCAALHAHAAPAFLAGPYQYLPLTQGAARILPRGTLTWAFASGEDAIRTRETGFDGEFQVGEGIAGRTVQTGTAMRTGGATLMIWKRGRRTLPVISFVPETSPSAWCIATIMAPK